MSTAKTPSGAERTPSTSEGSAWARNERIEPKRPRVPNPEVLAVRVATLAEKEELLAADPEKFFTAPH